MLAGRQAGRVAVVLAVALAGCGGDSGDGDDEPQKAAGAGAKPPALSAGVVARVGDVDITERTAQHWIEAARRQKPGCGSKRRCRQRAMQFLVSAQWLLQEAERLSVRVSDADVRREYRKQKREAFPSEADYREFLETSGRTEADLLLQVKLSLLTNELQKKTEGPGAKKRKQQRLETYVYRFRRAYKRKTICRRAYAPKGQCGKIVK